MRLVKDFMKKKVLCFGLEDSIFKVAKTFARKGISGAPVVEKGKVVGMISETDLIKFIKCQAIGGFRAELGLSLSLLDMLRKYISLSRQLKNVSKCKVKDVMNKTVISVKPDSSLSEAAELMDKYDIHRLPVIEDDKLVGIITRADLIHSLIK